jgi:hypothetical protein
LACGRRSGKTELAIRNTVIKAIKFHEHANGRFVLAAPTHKQASDIFWEKLLLMVPEELLLSEPSISGKYITLFNGVRIEVAGLDKPQRIEGSPLDGIVIDEFADMKPQTWAAHVRPALDTLERWGWAWLIGVPEGRNHFYKLAQLAMSGDEPDFEFFTWKSSSVLPPEIIEAARRQLDPLTFRQEYEAEFVTFEGHAYYAFSEENQRNTKYDPERDLVFCFDFNRSPGIAVVCQEHVDGTSCIDEVWIQNNSNTELVCQRLINKWAHHKGRVLIYGDATGGAKGSAKVKGSDWDIVRYMLKPHFNLAWRVAKSNPSVRSRINAVNTRLCRGDGIRHLYVDPGKCPKLILDFEGVRVADTGDLDKKGDPMLTHLSDALGYYIAARFPINPTTVARTSV